MTRDDIIRMAREADMMVSSDEWVFDEMLERFAALVAAREREACIRACDTVDLVGADECIAAIRARGEK